MNVYPTEVEEIVTILFGERIKECAVIGWFFLILKIQKSF